MDIIIRQETKSDQHEVFRLNSLAFGREDEAKLVDLLRESEAFIPELSLVATLNRQVIGHILFTKIEIIDRDHISFESLALAPMAVSPDIQKQGIGSKLIKYGLEKSRTLNFRSVIVLGHENYYPKFGFVPASRWGIKSPFKVPDNVFMGIELVNGGLEGVQGMVKYPREFGTV